MSLRMEFTAAVPSCVPRRGRRGGHMRGRRAFWLVCGACVALTACGTGPGGLSTGGGPAPSPGVIQLLTVSSDGVQADRATFSVSASGDGRFVVYSSFADNLVPADSN